MMDVILVFFELTCSIATISELVLFNVETYVKY